MHHITVQMVKDFPINSLRLSFWNSVTGFAFYFFSRTEHSTFFVFAVTTFPSKTEEGSSQLTTLMYRLWSLLCLFHQFSCSCFQICLHFILSVLLLTKLIIFLKFISKKVIKEIFVSFASINFLPSLGFIFAGFFDGFLNVC